MKDDYLWDKSGEPDPEVERLERLLGRFRHDQPAPQFPAAEPHPRRVWFLPLRRFEAAALAVAASLVLVLAGAWYVMRLSRPAWEVERVAGAPRIGPGRVGETGRLAVGEWLETDGASRARIAVGMIGEVEVEPNTRVRLVQARPTEHRLALERGTMHATIWAPPRLFYVDTPSAVAVDLGCRYVLKVDATGAGFLHVIMGWVAFEQQGRESFVPAGAMCATRHGSGPGTPYFDDASEAFQAALATLDSVVEGVSGGGAGGGSGGVSGGVLGGVAGGVGGGTLGTAKMRAAALDSVLAEARKRDALTLWHLLGRINNAERARVYDCLAALVPPPAGVTREAMLNGDAQGQRQMRDLWWDALGLGDTSWWRMWKGPIPLRSR